MKDGISERSSDNQITGLLLILKKGPATEIQSTKSTHGRKIRVAENNTYPKIA